MIKPSKPLSTGVLAFGFLFLYIPIISLVVYSFNESKLVTVWSGFSLKRYAALWQDDAPAAGGRHEGGVRGGLSECGGYGRCRRGGRAMRPPFALLS
ncbi:hypothetical protein [Burkholderia anthina]|uniref:hypothetical protein n=1 Tax=Burkholderia anthina TaxID=179879 RepID=UPI001ABA5F99|nr:hypothetical protein [Burkholderia anthina]